MIYALSVVIENNNANRILELAAIIAAFFVLYALISIPMANKRLKRLKEAKKKILENHEKIEAENERRRKANVKIEMEKENSSR